MALSPQDRCRLIVEAEVIDFKPEQLGPLNTVLRDFIAECRESNSPDDLVAVSSAIRKCVATLKADEALSYTSQLLEAGPRTPVPLEVELELVKMIVRKLTANPPEPNDSLPELGDRLLEIAKIYLNPRLLVREKYGAVTLNAILALVLLRSRHVAEVSQILSELKVPWFRQLVARRAETSSAGIEGKIFGRTPGETGRFVRCTMKSKGSQARQAFRCRLASSMAIRLRASCCSWIKWLRTCGPG